jgi:hypothetical protein
MLQCYEVVEAGCKSKRKSEHLHIGLQKLHQELLTMDGNFDKDKNDDDVGSIEVNVLSNQVLSNLTFTLQDLVHVRCRGKPKSLRQKNPKENKKRTCTICKQTWHVRTNCPSRKQARYSICILRFIMIYIKMLLI